MIYGQGIYAEDEFLEVDVTGEYDIEYYIYRNRVISNEPFTWSLYKRSNLSDQFEEIATDTISSGELKINLNDYGLQFEDNNYLIKIIREMTNTVIVNNSFWYYWRIYTKEPLRVPWYIGTGSVQDTGGGNIGAVPIYQEKKIPNIRIDDIDEKENDIEISILYMNDK